MRMRHIVICDLPALQYFSVLSHKRHDFFLGGGEVIAYKMCSVSTTFIWNILFILRKNARDRVKNVPVTLVRFLWNLDFLDGFSQNTQISNFLKICPVGAELFYAGRRTDVEAISHFSQFCERT